MTTQRKRERRDGAKTIFPQRFVVADEVRSHFGLARASCDHGLHEVMIRVALVGESLAVYGYRDHAGFRTIDEVRHHTARTVLARSDRYWNPGGGMRQRCIDFAADRFGQAQTVAGVSGRSG